MRRRDWFGIVLLLWLAFFLRSHLIDTMPPFNDESLHVRRAEVVFSDRDIALTPAKALVYFWVGLFGVDRESGVWVGRVAISLFALLGLAGVYATAKQLFGRFAGWFGLVLATFSPFMIFFDRMILSDPFSAVLVILLVWLSVRFAQKPNRSLAIGLGVMMFLVGYAKFLNLSLVVLPPLALLLYQSTAWPSNYQPRTMYQWAYEGLWPYRRLLITIYAIFALSWLPSILHILERTISGQQVMIVNNNLVSGLAEEKTPPQILLDNLGTVWDVDWTLHSPLLWGAILFSAGVLLWKRWRDGMFLLASIGLAWSVSVALSAELSTRYLLPGTLIVFVMVGGAADTLGQTRPITKWAMWVLVGLWIGLFALPFINTAWDDPAKLALPPRDEWEYFSNFSSGYGLVAAAEDFYDLPPSQPSGRVNVFGLVGSCHQIRLYLPDAYAEDDGPVWLTCLEFGWQGELIPQVIDQVEARLMTESDVYLLMEPDLPFFDPIELAGYWQWQKIKEYPRPHDGMPIVLYYIRPMD